MKKNATLFNSFPTYYYLLIGMLYLVAVLRDIFSFRSLIEWILLFALVMGMALSYRIKAVWFTFYCYILILFYNPYFLVFHAIQDSYTADILIGLSFFMIALHWKKFIHT